ncbi:MAG: hypothetical protein Q8M78_12285 [Burkholderiaceae bacterium]|nr:hypothetical protein [Burkholderiaceae bacterium]
MAQPPSPNAPARTTSRADTGSTVASPPASVGLCLVSHTNAG